MKTAGRLSVILGLVILNILFRTGPAAADVTTLKLAHVVSVSGAYHLGAQEFARLVAIKSRGKVLITIYPNGQLGAGEKAILEGMQKGTIDLIVTSTGPVGAIVPEMLICDFPYLFRNTDHADHVLDGNIGRFLMEELSDAGIRGIAFWENGFRHLTNSRRPVLTPEDLQGLTVRTMENEIHQDYFRELGANPVPLPWGQLYTDLKKRSIDGQENPIAIIRTEKIYEVNQYLTLTRHVYSPALLLMNAKKFSSLNPAQRQAIWEAGQEAAWWERRLVRESEEKMLLELQASGMTVITPDRAPFRKAAQAVYKKYQDRVGKDLLRKIRRVK